MVVNQLQSFCTLTFLLCIPISFMFYCMHCCYIHALLTRVHDIGQKEYHKMSLQSAMALLLKGYHNYMHILCNVREHMTQNDY